MPNLEIVDKSRWIRLTPDEQLKIARKLASLAGKRVKANGVSQDLVIKRLMSALDRSDRLFIRTNAGSVEAAVYQFWDENIIPGLKVREVRLAARSEPSVAEIRWIMSRLRALAPSWNSRTIVALRIDQKVWTGKLGSLGFGIEFVVLQGETSKALTAIRQKYGTVSRARPEGIALRSMRNEDLDSVIRIKRREFRRNPQYGWMCAKEAYPERERKQFRDEVKSGKPYHFVFVDQGEIVGYCGICPNPNGKHSGVELVFDQEYQGRGLARVGYAKMLNQLHNMGIPYFQGGTSHPAVLRMAGTMRRKPIALVYRFGQFENQAAILRALKAF